MQDNLISPFNVVFLRNISDKFHCVAIFSRNEMNLYGIG